MEPNKENEIIENETKKIFIFLKQTNIDTYTKEIADY